MRALELLLVAILSVQVSACAAAAPAGTVGSEPVKAAVRSATNVTVSEQPLEGQFAELREQGTQAVLANPATAVRDGQLVIVAIMDSADRVDQVRDRIRQMQSGVGDQGRVFTHRNLVVFYLRTTGADNAAALESAIKDL